MPQKAVFDRIASHYLPKISGRKMQNRWDTKTELRSRFLRKVGYEYDQINAQDLIHKSYVDLDSEVRYALEFNELLLLKLR